MLPPNLQKPESELEILSSKKPLGDGSSNYSRMEEEDSPSSKVNTNKNQHLVGYISRGSKCKSHFTKQASDKSFRSLNSSGSGGSCGPGLLTSSRPTIPTRNIVNRALEVMSNSMKDADYIPRQTFKSAEDCDTEEESEKDQTLSDSSNSSDNDNDINSEPTSRLGDITAQLSFRKIAKKRRKAGGRISFHHTKSSKEYLRKAQEAYQRLKINEQEQQNDRDHEPESESGREIGENSTIQCKCAGPKAFSEKSIESTVSEEIDYGYGDISDQQTNDAIGYGDPEDSQSQQTVDYGYGDPVGGQPQHSRRGERVRRRNSVTKFSLEAANVVAAQAAAKRILQLKPSLTSLSRSYSTTPTRRRQSQDQTQQLNNKKNGSLTTGTTGRLAVMQAKLQRQYQQYPENQRDKTERIVKKIVADVLEPPQKPFDHVDGLCSGRGPIMKNSPRQQDQTESKQSKNDNSSVLQLISSHSKPHFQMTSDYFSSDPKPKNLSRKNSGRFSSTTFRFKTPVRTSSWLSHDNSYSTVNNNDDDADSLASDMESLCSIRDDNNRQENHQSNHTLKNTDIPSVLPISLASPPPDCRSRFTSGSSSSGEGIIRKPLIVSWSNGSKEDRSLSHFAADKSERQSNGNEFPILPSVGIAKTGRSVSKSCMPAPVNRTPSYKGSQQRQV